MADAVDVVMSVRELRVAFRSGRAPFRPAQALRGLDLDIRRGETLAIIGESGSGKSVLARSLVGLNERRTTILSGSIRYFPPSPDPAIELANATEPVFRSLRGKKLAMVFQDPLNSLNPLMRIGDQIVEALMVGRGLDRRQALALVPGLLERAGIGRPTERLRQYPHEFSGGMLQRVMILMATSAQADLLIADEPTSALDSTVQNLVLDLIAELKAELGMTVLLITHDFGLVERRASRVAVMYAGEVIESGPTASLLAHPRHPYTAGLIASIPRPHSRRTGLYTIPGFPPAVSAEISGCAFARRCPYRIERCEREHPAAQNAVRCHRAAELDLRPGASS